MNVNKIQPINNLHLIQLEDRNEDRLIHLAGSRSITSARPGKCVRSDRWTDSNLLISSGGIPISDDENLVMVTTRAVIRVEGEIQEPYLHIEPIELVRSELIITPEIYNYSGWYRILDIFPQQTELSAGDIILPIYGTPRLEMEDDTEYISIEGVGVVQCTHR